METRTELSSGEVAFAGLFTGILFAIAFLLAKVSRRRYLHASGLSYTAVQSSRTIANVDRAFEIVDDDDD